MYSRTIPQLPLESDLMFFHETLLDLAADLAAEALHSVPSTSRLRHSSWDDTVNAEDATQALEEITIATLAEKAVPDEHDMSPPSAENAQYELSLSGNVDENCTFGN